MLFIFDMGGVVSRNVQTIPAMAQRLSVSIEEFFLCCGVPQETKTHALYDHGLLAEIQSGVINSEIFWEKFRKTAKDSLPKEHPGQNPVSIVTKQENLWATCFKPELISQTVTLIETLKEKGHRVVCGTNTLDAHYEIHSKANDYEVFHKVYASHLMGVIKPDQAFWKMILKSEKTAPCETVFIDDNHPNVESAQALGLRSFLFTTPEVLIQDLSQWTKRI